VRVRSADVLPSGPRRTAVESTNNRSINSRSGRSRRGHGCHALSVWDQHHRRKRSAGESLQRVGKGEAMTKEEKLAAFTEKSKLPGIKTGHEFEHSLACTEPMEVGDCGMDH